MHHTDDMMFAEEELPCEGADPWSRLGAGPAAPAPPAPARVPALLAAALAPGGDDAALTQLIAVTKRRPEQVDVVGEKIFLDDSKVLAVTSEAKRYRASGGAAGPFPYLEAVCGHLARAPAALPAAGARGVALLRALIPANSDRIAEMAESLLSKFKCVGGPLAEVLRGLARGAAAVQESLPDVPPHATREQLITALECATPSTLEAVGNKMIESCSTALVVDVISQVLENNQAGRYETKVKSEESGLQQGHLFARGGLGCGLLLDWLSELQQETLGAQPDRQMRLMFRRGWGAWRPQLATQLAHRASWRTLHACTTALLDPTQSVPLTTEHSHSALFVYVLSIISSLLIVAADWAASAVVEFCATLVDSPRVCQGRDRQAAKHAPRDDTLRLSHAQLEVLIRYVVAEAREAEEGAGGGEAGAEAMRRRMEARLPLVLRCCPSAPALLAAALQAAHHPPLLLLLYMKVPKIQQLLLGCSERSALSASLTRTLRAAAAGAGAVGGAGAAGGARAAATSATDRVSHALLTALHAATHHTHSKEHNNKVYRLEAGVRGVWARVWGAGARALPLCGALLRGAPPARHHHHLLAAVELLPDHQLLDSEEIHGIVDCYLSVCKQQTGRDSALVHRVAALLRRYLALRPARAAALLHAHRDTVASTPALSALNGAELNAPSSAAPPPHALLALQRRTDPPEELHWLLQVRTFMSFASISNLII
ncbi:unnamed protein product [Diatraea saccharalis]|uniref:Integrator complex subunit 1 R3 domain-containing protein n=1 Tax=Diatraea saccharalis TaxID=40085 RepID=A0A9N9R4R2_9NEOP|nr:unnamed protein product [Diatraea saccharalis]